VTIEVLQQRGQSQRETAQILGVSEGTVRYHLRRAKEAATDGRQKPSLIGLRGVRLRGVKPIIYHRLRGVKPII